MRRAMDNHNNNGRNHATGQVDMQAANQTTNQPATTAKSGAGRGISAFIRAIALLLFTAAAGTAWAGASSTALTSNANPSGLGQSVTLTATVTGTSPTGTVTFTDGYGTVNLGTATLNGSGVATLNYTFTTAGIHYLLANYGGDANNSPSNNPYYLAQNVVKANTLTTLSSGLNPSGLGQSVTLTAAVTGGISATGTITFMDGATTLGTATLNGSGVATLNYTFVTTGSHYLAANYGGDANNNASSGTLTQSVNRATPTTTLTSTPNPSSIGQSVTFTATMTGASSPTGTMWFSNANTGAPLGSANISNGTATLTLPFNNAVSIPVNTYYSGDANNTSSTSNTITQVVNKVTSSVTLTSNHNPAAPNQQPLTLTATISGSASPSGSVTFYDGGTYLGYGNPNNGVVTFSYTFTQGTHNLTASYGGDANNTASASNTLIQTVAKATTATTLTSSANPSAPNQAVTLTATISGGSAPGGTVTFLDDTTTLGTATVTSGTASLSYTFTTQGTHNLTASYAGDANNLASTSAALNQTVALATSGTTLSSSANPALTNQAITLTATVTGSSPGGTITFLDGATTLGTASLTNGTTTFNYTFTNAGTHSLTASYPGDANNASSTSAALSQTINAAPAQAYYIQPDQLDTPRTITDTSGNVVWQWDNADPFGNNVPNENPSNQGQFSFNLRFPGQYFDKETSLAYNVNRDYDAATGRYIESDPIGLYAGVNTFAYVRGNPLGLIDPFGLAAQCDLPVEGPLGPDDTPPFECTKQSETKSPDYPGQKRCNYACRTSSGPNGIQRWVPSNYQCPDKLKNQWVPGTQNPKDTAAAPETSPSTGNDPFGTNGNNGKNSTQPNNTGMGMWLLLGTFFIWVATQ